MEKPIGISAFPSMRPSMVNLVHSSSGIHIFDTRVSVTAWSVSNGVVSRVPRADQEGNIRS